MALYTSKKNIIRITFFMENFLNITYDEEEKLTHRVMREFLLEKGKSCPKVALFSRIKQEDILTGRILIVKDEVGKCIGYYNPGANFPSLLNELKRQYTSKTDELCTDNSPFMAEELESSDNFELVKRKSNVIQRRN